jgi:hypothetical protein
LFGKYGLIRKRGPDLFVAYIFNESRKLADSKFSDLLPFPQKIVLKKSGLDFMVQYLEVPLETKRQLRMSRRYCYSNELLLKLLEKPDPKRTPAPPSGSPLKGKGESVPPDNLLIDYLLEGGRVGLTLDFATIPLEKNKKGG